MALFNRKNHLKIGYSPYRSENSYVTQTKKALSNLGTIVEAPSFIEVIKNPIVIFRNRVDISVVNWMENLLVSEESGKLNWLGIVRFFIKYTILRIMSRKLVFVKHNNYPHHTKKECSERVEKVVHYIEHLFNISVTHSGHNVSQNRFYVPHPLYDGHKKIQKQIIGVKRNYFIIFGRVLPYKNILSLVSAFPEDKRLIIVGPCSDKDYLEMLRNSAAGKNIDIRIGFIEEEEAEDLVSNAAGLIICHSNSNMIVSGSYFYAASLGVPVYAITTPFFDWALTKLNALGLYAYKDITELCAGLDAHSTKVSRESIKKFANDFYGNEEVVKHWRVVLKKIDMPY